MKYSCIFRIGLSIVLNIFLLFRISSDVSQAQSSQVASANVQIAFTSSVVFKEHIYVSNLDGTNFRQVTHNLRNLDVQWSPDGRYLVSFAAFFGPDDQIYLTDVNTEESTQLTPDGLNAYWPIWSPDGNHIAYTFTELGDICIVQVDNLETVCPTKNIDSYIVTAFASWSPDGQQLSFNISCCRENTDIGVVNADGSDLRYLTDTESTESSGEWPKWSPDGQYILFTSGIEGKREIMIINADGSRLSNLSQSEADDYDLSWSPDGSQIVFTSNREEGYQIYHINVDGSDLVRLTNLDTSRYSPRIRPFFFPLWSPDGTKIAFMYGGDLYVMNADGTGMALVTETSGLDLQRSSITEFRWLPDSQGLIFLFSYRASDFRDYSDIRWVDISCLETTLGCTSEDMVVVRNTLYANRFDIYPSTMSSIP